MELRDVRRFYGKTVTYRGIQYRLDKCIETPDGNGGYKYSLELHDLQANSATVARIEEVKIKENE